MARVSGKNGRLYVNIASGGTPEPIAFINSFSLQATQERQDVTSFGDSNKTYISGFSDAQGSFAGFWDDSTQQLYTAAVDGVARKWYWYPDTGTTTRYWFGTAFFDFSVEESVSGPVSISGTWAAASSVNRVG